MSYTLKEIRDDVKITISPEGDSTLSDSFYNRRINDAIQEIVIALELPEFEKTNETVTLVSGTRSYSMSSFDPLWVISVKDKTYDQFLTAMVTRQADNFSETETGSPSQWFRYGNSLEIYPLPSSTHVGDVLRVRYLKTPSLLSSDNDVSPLPTNLDRAVREYAIAAALSDLNEPELASLHFRIYQAIVKSRKKIRGKELRYQNRILSVRRFE